MEHIRPSTVMTRDEFATRLNVPLSTVKEWMRPGGILHGVPRLAGEFYPADLAVGAALLELQALLGERSRQAVEYARQLGPRIRQIVASGAPRRLRVRIPGTALAVDIDLEILNDTVRQYAAGA